MDVHPLHVIGVIGIGVVAGFLTGIITGDIRARKDVCQEAIQAGVAHYSVNPQTGQTHFAWNLPNVLDTPDLTNR